MALRQIFFGLWCLSLPVLVFTLSPVESPAADINTVCSSTDPADCYPQIFQPTHEFQTIREGQDIPQGLHVRMNIYTGEKEARLIVPLTKDSDIDKVAPEISTKKAMVFVPQPPELEQEELKQSVLRDPPVEPPKYNPAGKIQPPPPSDSHEIGIFQNSLSMLKTEGHSFDQALDDLSELTHDIYYGLELAKDSPAIEKLICLTLGLGSDSMPFIENNRKHKAAAILASALQNNPTALKELSAYNRMVMYPSCANSEGVDSFVSILRGKVEQEEDAETLKVKIRAISGLLKESSIRDVFLQEKGMELLLATFLKRGEKFNIVRKKVGELITDNFLDESLGAELNIWPNDLRSSESACKTQEGMYGDGCWEHHIEEFSVNLPGEKWPQELLLAFKDRRTKEVTKSEL